MSSKYILHHAERDFEIEDFDDAIVCDGCVFLRERVEHGVTDAPGQCWGEYVEFSAGCFVNGEYMPRSGSLCIDSPGDEYIITDVTSLSPLRLDTRRHVGVENSAPDVRRHIAELDVRSIDGGAAVCGFHGSAHSVLIPACIGGQPISRVDLREADMGEVETLIISPDIKELALELFSAPRLRRLQLPEGIRLLCPLNGISSTPWFASQKAEPIYISGCYCGTPGGGSGSPARSLVIPEGIASVAAGADFHCYWHSIKTPESLKHIGRLAFASCYCLEELNLGEGLANIDTGAFHTLPRLKGLYLPSSLRTLGRYCFSRCDYLQSVSIPAEELVSRFPVHSITLRLSDGEKQLSACPPFTVSLCDRISSFPPRSPFTAAGREYESTDCLALHPLADFGFEYLDTHGQRLWRIGARDDVRRGPDGEKLLVVRWFIKTAEGVTQIEKTVDGTVLVRENINIIDVDWAVRNTAAREVFGL